MYTAKTGVVISRRHGSEAREDTYPRADDIFAGRRTGYEYYSRHRSGELMCDQMRYSEARMFCVEAVGADSLWHWAYACAEDAYVYTSWMAEVLLPKVCLCGIP